jgi:hypothetical protein
MTKNPMTRLQTLEKSLGGPEDVPLLVGLDESDTDIVEALASLDSDVEYHLSLRDFRGSPTLFVTARKVTPAEVAELEKLYEDTSPEGDGAADDDDTGADSDSEADDDE